jgi:hypothetical protein
VETGMTGMGLRIELLVMLRVRQVSISGRDEGWR